MATPSTSTERTTIDHAAKELTSALRPHKWFVAVGVESGLKDPSLIVYVKWMPPAKWTVFYKYPVKYVVSGQPVPAR